MCLSERSPAPRRVRAHGDEPRAIDCGRYRRDRPARMADVVAAQNVMSRSRRLIRAHRVIRYRVEKDRELRCTVARAAYASQLLRTPQFAERARGPIIKRGYVAVSASAASDTGRRSRPCR